MGTGMVGLRLAAYMNILSIMYIANQTRPRKKFDDIFSHLDTMHDGKTDGLTPADSKNQVYAERRAVKACSFYAALLPRRGPHYALHSVCLSVCLSSVRPVIVTERHVAPPSELQ